MAAWVIMGMAGTLADLVLGTMRGMAVRSLTVVKTAIGWCN